MACALLASAAAAAPAAAKTFNDVPATHWAYSVIDEMSNKGIMNGTGTGIFSPNTMLTRAEYATMLYNMSPNKNMGADPANFYDLTASDWYYTPAQWAASNGIMGAGGTGGFDGNDRLSREYMAFMTYQFLAKYHTGVLDTAKDKSYGFSDQTDISQGSQWYVNVLANNGFVAGKDGGRFDPQAMLTRAEAAAMTSRIAAAAAKTPNTGNTNNGTGNNTNNGNNNGSTPASLETNPTPGFTKYYVPLLDMYCPTNMDQFREIIAAGIAPSQIFVKEIWEKCDPALPSNKRYISLSAEETAQLIAAGANADEIDQSAIPGTSDYNRKQEQLEQEKAEQQREQQRKEEKERIRALLDDDNVELTADEQELVDLVNQARRENGLKELKISRVAMDAARARAKEASEKFANKLTGTAKERREKDTPEFAHSRMDGSSFMTIYDDLGYDFNKGPKIGCRENLATQFWNSGSRQAQSCDVHKAHESLMNSPGHKANIMDTENEYIGVGTYVGEDETVWAEEFLGMNDAA